MISLYIEFAFFISIFEFNFLLAVSNVIFFFLTDQRFQVGMDENYIFLDAA